MLRKIRRYLPSTGIVLIAAAFALGLSLVWPAPSSQAVSTEVFITPAGRTSLEPIVGFLGGPTELADVRVDKLVHPTGLGSFEFTVNYNPEVVSVLDVTEGPFLSSSGRATICTAPVITTTSVNFSCNSFTSAPDGPLGSGVLATIKFVPATTFGSKTSTIFTFAKSHITDISGDVPISHVALDGSMLVAKCGDFNADKTVTVGDIILISSRFGENQGPPPTANWDPAFDLNGDGAVTIGDLLIEVQQFGRQCNA